MNLKSQNYAKKYASTRPREPRARGRIGFQQPRGPKESASLSPLRLLPAADLSSPTAGCQRQLRPLALLVPSRAARPPAAGFDSGAGIGTWIKPLRARTPSDDSGAIRGDLIAGHRPTRGFRGRFRARTPFDDLGAIPGHRNARARRELNFNAGLWPHLTSTLRTGPAIVEALLQNRFWRATTGASCHLCAGKPPGGIRSPIGGSARPSRGQQAISAIGGAISGQG
jgi:hypothetical protein